LKPATYTLTEEVRPGYNAVIVVSNPVSLSCANVTYQNFTNQKLYCISGFKLDACTNVGLPGWLVTLTNGTYTASATTDATGYYQFCGLKPGAYIVRETVKSGWSAVTSPVKTLTLPCNTNLTKQNFTNQKLLCTVGYKKDGCSSAFLSGWTIKINNSTYSASTTTDATGRYQFCGLMPGTYTVTETVKPGWSPVSSPVKDLTLLCTNNLTGRNFTNIKKLCISGYKIDDCTKAGLPGWTVTLTNGTYTVSQTTDGTGKYQFCGLMPGAYTVRETVKSGCAAPTSPVLNLTLPCNANLTNQNFTNSKKLCISGYKIDDCTKAGLPGWTIVVSNDTDRWPILTDKDGFWEKCNLTPGNYTICEDLQSGWTQVSPKGCHNATLVNESISNLVDSFQNNIAIFNR
jgi:large repetitive protein